MAKKDPLDVARDEEAKDEAGITDLTPTFWFAWQVTTTIDGKEVTTPKRLPFRIDQVLPKHVRLLRDCTRSVGRPDGWTTGELYRAAGGQNDIDAAALMWWMTRLQNGEPHVTLDECEEGVTSENHPTMIAGPDHEEDPNSPEA